MKRALVIIDMQRGFDNANAQITITKVIKQIKRAKKFNDKIIIVEYLPHVSYKKTRPEIIKAIGDYNHIKVYKYKNNGADPIIKACKKHNFKIDVFRLCGVNTNACVKSTMTGLYNKKKYRLEIVPEACNSYAEDTIDLFQQISDQFDVKFIGPIPSKKPVRYIK